MWKLVIYTVLVALTGCGGGSADPSQNNPSGQILTSQIAKVADSECVVKPIRKPNTYRSAVLDMRFDQPDFNNQGMLVNSYHAVTLYIDKINCVGFDTVVFQTNTPIDTVTGALMLYDPDASHYNRNKSIPQDFWPLVDYAKKKGLTVFIKLDRCPR